MTIEIKAIEVWVRINRTKFQCENIEGKYWNCGFCNKEIEPDVGYECKTCGAIVELVAAPLHHKHHHQIDPYGTYLAQGPCCNILKR